MWNQSARGSNESRHLHEKCHGLLCGTLGASPRLCEIKQCCTLSIKSYGSRQWRRVTATLALEVMGPWPLCLGCWVIAFPRRGYSCCCDWIIRPSAREVPFEARLGCFSASVSASIQYSVHCAVTKMHRFLLKVISHQRHLSPVDLFLPMKPINFFSLTLLPF